MVGSLILVYTIDLDRPALFEGSFYLSVLMLLLMVVTAPAYDAGRRARGGQETRDVDVKG